MKDNKIAYTCQIDGCDNTKTVYKKQYDKRKHKYCSQECYQKSRTNMITFECEDKDCNNTRTVHMFMYKARDKHYCSRGCFHKNIESKGKNPDKCITFECDRPECSTMKTEYKSLYSKKKSHYCSKTCYHQHRTVLMREVRESKSKIVLSKKDAFRAKWNEMEWR